MNDIQKELLTFAEKAALLSYSPYSNYRVGSAVYTEKGVFIGTNIENASSNLGICAERVAISNAFVNEATSIEGIAICCLDAKDELNLNEYMPCGACRQWLAELAPKAWIVIHKSNKIYTLDDLLPYPFKLRS